MDKADKRSLVIAAFLVVGAGLFFLEFGGDKNLHACEEALKEQLKAPRTYHRVSFSQPSSTSYEITYDAENAFGVPIRGHGRCDPMPGTDIALWHDDALRAPPAQGRGVD